jgi:hypothetical protein
MQRHECNKQLFIYLFIFLEFYFLVKIRVLHFVTIAPPTVLGAARVIAFTKAA